MCFLRTPCRVRAIVGGLRSQEVNHQKSCVDHAECFLDADCDGKKCDCFAPRTPFRGSFLYAPVFSITRDHFGGYCVCS